MNRCNAFTGECEQGHGCPVRECALPPDAQQPAATHCCHLPNCTDPTCPGRADRPPHPARLHNHNSDGSCQGYDPKQTIEPDWRDDLLYWVQMAFIAMAAAAFFGAAAGYFLA